MKTEKNAEVIASHELLAVQTIPGFAVMPPDGWDDDFKPIDSLAWDAEQAWIRFCHPALKREGSWVEQCRSLWRSVQKFESVLFCVIPHADYIRFEFGVG